MTKARLFHDDKILLRISISISVPNNVYNVISGMADQCTNTISSIMRGLTIDTSFDIYKEAINMNYDEDKKLYGKTISYMIRQDHYDRLKGFADKLGVPVNFMIKMHIIKFFGLQLPIRKMKVIACTKSYKEALIKAKTDYNISHKKNYSMMSFLTKVIDGEIKISNRYNLDNTGRKSESFTIWTYNTNVTNNEIRSKLQSLL